MRWDLGSCAEWNGSMGCAFARVTLGDVVEILKWTTIEDAVGVVVGVFWIAAHPWRYNNKGRFWYLVFVKGGVEVILDRIWGLGVNKVVWICQHLLKISRSLSMTISWALTVLSESKFSLRYEEVWAHPRARGNWEMKIWFLLWWKKSELWSFGLPVQDKLVGSFLTITWWSMVWLQALSWDWDYDSVVGQECNVYCDRIEKVQWEWHWCQSGMLASETDCRREAVPGSDPCPLSSVRVRAC